MSKWKQNEDRFPLVADLLVNILHMYSDINKYQHEAHARHPC